MSVSYKIKVAFYNRKLLYLIVINTLIVIQYYRYEDLLMYDVQGVISCAVFRNDSRLLLASSRGKDCVVIYVGALLLVSNSLNRNKICSLLYANYDFFLGNILKKGVCPRYYY